MMIESLIELAQLDGARNLMLLRDRTARQTKVYFAYPCAGKLLRGKDGVKVPVRYELQQIRPLTDFGVLHLEMLRLSPPDDAHACTRWTIGFFGRDKTKVMLSIAINDEAAQLICKSKTTV